MKVIVYDYVEQVEDKMIEQVAEWAANNLNIETIADIPNIFRDSKQQARLCVAIGEMIELEYNKII